MRRIGKLLSLLGLVGLLLGLLPVSLSARSPDELVVVRLYVRDRDHLNDVAGELDIWEAHPDAGYVVAAVRPATYRWLEALGYVMEVDPARTATLGVDAPLDPRFYYFDDYYPNPSGRYIVDFLQETNATYPDLTELYDIGDAWMAGQPGEHDRDIWVLRITNEDPAYGAIEDKPVFFLFSTIHAREVAVPEVTIRYIKYLLEGYNGAGGYGVDADATWLVNHNVLYALVMQNPDGHWVDEQEIGNYRRKNMDWDDGCNDPASWGTDLNRNHSFFWGCCGGSSGDPCSETYRGPDRASEPETQAFQNYFATVIEDQNGPNGDDEIPDPAPDDATGIFITLHSYSDLVLWPWGFTGYGDPPNYDQLKKIGRKFAYYTDYDPTGTIWYDVDGATDDWTYGKFGIASYTFEVGPSGGMCGGFFPAYECIEGEGGAPENFWAENLPAFLYAHKIARTPYMTGYGPDAEDLVLIPAVIAPGEPVQLSATITDHRLAGDPVYPISATEYFIDAPGEDGTGLPMAPADGSWGDLSEVVTATVDTTGLPVGQHYILVHGQNDQGDWGPFTAIFLHIFEEGVSPVIEGYVRDGGTNAPLSATVTAGNFQAYTDPATGYYHMTVISDTYDVSALATGYVISDVSGVFAPNYQTVQQNFYLYPTCELFFDDVESGNQGWTADPPWAITTEASHSPDHAWTDSPGGTYSNSINISLTSPLFDLSDYGEVSLDFWHAYSLQDYWDFGYVEVSTDDGGTWSEVASYSGEVITLTWSQQTIGLPMLDGQAGARFRYRLQTNPYFALDGWYIDDITLRGGGPACVSPLSPTAQFTSTSPVMEGTPVDFVNLTTGSRPLSYRWNFGDGATSAEEHPTHLYAGPGTFTVTLAATNSLGADLVRHPVVVEPCVGLETITIDGALSGTPGLYTFTTHYSPPTASLPVDYLWDDGETVSTSVRLLDVGTYTLAVTATNCTDTVVVDAHTVVIEEPCTPLSDVHLSLATTATIHPSDVVTLHADIAPDDADKPYTYRLTIDGVPGLTLTADADPLVLTETFAATGTHTVAIAGWNCDLGEAEAVTDTITLTVEPVPPVCVGLESITIHGVSTGTPGIYTFTTSYLPVTASLPVDYLWDDGEAVSTSVRLLDVGTYTLAVTATNCADTAVSATHSVVIHPVGGYLVYLPIVAKQ